MRTASLATLSQRTPLTMPSNGLDRGGYVVQGDRARGDSQRDEVLLDGPASDACA